MSEATALERLLEAANYWWDDHSKLSPYDPKWTWVDQWYARVEVVLESLTQRVEVDAQAWNGMTSIPGFFSDRPAPRARAFRERRDFVASIIQRVLLQEDAEREANEQPSSSGALAQHDSSEVESLRGLLSAYHARLQGNAAGSERDQEEAAHWLIAADAVLASGGASDSATLRACVIRLQEIASEFMRAAPNRGHRSSWASIVDATEQLLSERGHRNARWF